jgi:hypothetical protein
MNEFSDHQDRGIAAFARLSQTEAEKNPTRGACGKCGSGELVLHRQEKKSTRFQC